MYIVTKGLGERLRWLAIFWSVLLFLQFAISGAIQSNSIADVMNASFGIKHLYVGIALGIIAGIVIIGGIKRIGQFAEKVVPTMAILYIVSGLIIILINVKTIPSVFQLIFSSAFRGVGPTGGFIGASFTTMIRNGNFSNSSCNSNYRSSC